MNEKEKEAIERCKQLIKVEHANWIGISNQLAIITLLNLIEKKDKIIDLMAESISNLDIDEDICMKNIANTDLCNEDYTKCKECVIEHFNQKIEKGD